MNTPAKATSSAKTFRRMSATPMQGSVKPSAPPNADTDRRRTAAQVMGVAAGPMTCAGRTPARSQLRPSEVGNDLGAGQTRDDFDNARSAAAENCIEKSAHHHVSVAREIHGLGGA